MKRSCDACGRSYEAQRSTSKYCGASCRAKVSTGTVTPHPSATPVPVPGGELEEATRRELVAAGRETTALGVSALVLARRIDSAQDPGTALAALSARHEAILATATRNAKIAESPLDRMRDELAERRRGA